MRKRISSIIIYGIFLLLLSGCNGRDSSGDVNRGNFSLEQLKLPKENEEIAVLYTNYGEIKIRLLKDAAPKAVENFKGLIQNGFYNGKSFIRIRKEDFVMSGDLSGTSIWGKPFEDEFNIAYRHLRGAVGMANSGPDTNTNSFYIVSRNYLEDDIEEVLGELTDVDGFPKDVVKAYKKLGGLPELDFTHTVYGQVFSGMDVVDKIANVQVDNDFKPEEVVIIEKAEIEEYHK